MSIQNENENNEIEKDNISEITPAEVSAEENKETSVPEKIETETAVQEEAESNVSEENKEIEIKAEDKIKGVSGKDSFISIMIDQAISLGISAAALFIIDAIMKLFGWQISDKEGMFIIFFVIVNVVYNTVMHTLKASSTFGEKLAHLKITK